MMRLSDESLNLPKIKIAVKIIDELNYDIIYLGGDVEEDWEEGDIKGKITKTATPNLYIVDWYSFERTLTEDVYCNIDESNLLNFIFPQGYSLKFLKLFPTNTGYDYNSGDLKGTGTGFALTNDGFIVTAQHVVNERNTIIVKGINGNHSLGYNAKLVIEDKNNDLAIIKIEDEKFQELGNIPYIFKSEGVEVGENVFVLGYPMMTTMGSEIKLTNGIINSKTGFSGDVTSYQFSAQVQPGNSGGPLFDKSGNLIGVISAKHKLADNAYYAVKIVYLKNMIEALTENIQLPVKNLLKNKTLSDQLKILRDYVYIIEIK